MTDTAPLVILLRHGTSPPGIPGRDRDRPLAEGSAERLRRGARALADYAPVVALVSSARRTQETADAVLSEIGTQERVDRDDLYNASADGIAEAVGRALTDGAATVLVIAHNPGISAAAHDLSGGAATDPLRPGDAVVCARRDGVWSLVASFSLEAR